MPKYLIKSCLIERLLQELFIKCKDINGDDTRNKLFVECKMHLSNKRCQLITELDLFH